MAGCTHFWIIEGLELGGNGQSKGVCQRCGEERMFDNRRKEITGEDAIRALEKIGKEKAAYERREGIRPSSKPLWYEPRPRPRKRLYLGDRAVLGRII